MHQMQIQSMHGGDAKSSVKSQKTSGEQNVRGDSFSSVLKKTSQPDHTKINTDHEKRNPEHTKKSEGKLETKKKTGKTGKKNVFSEKNKKTKKGHISFPVPDKRVKSSKRTVQKSKEAAEKQNKVTKKDVVSEPDKGGKKKRKTTTSPLHTDLSGILLQPGVLKTIQMKKHKTSEKNKKTKGMTDLAEVAHHKDTKSSKELHLIDLRSKNHSKKKGVEKTLHIVQESDSILKNVKQNHSQGETVKQVSVLQTGETGVTDTPRFFAPSDDKAVLLKELQERMNNRIVKESGIILKDNNSGEIKLILKPESMGKVRIRLHMQDNHLTGKIFVDNPEARDIFERNMFGLEKAFSDRGFSMGSLDVSVGNREGNSAHGEDKNIPEQVLKVIENSVPGIEEYRYSDNLIDLVV